MTYNRDIHHRRSIRLPGYDYSRAGAYFVTLCAHERQCLFGDIVDGEIRLNDFGRIVVAEWIRSDELRAEIEIGEYVVMPNHFHGIVMINDIVGIRDVCRGEWHSPGLSARPVAQNAGQIPFEKSGDQPGGDQPGGDQPVAPTRGPQTKSIGAMMAGFKSAVTKRINIYRDTPGVPVWQRNYYEHVIRDDADYTRIAEYVTDNPRRWMEDKLHPDNCDFKVTTEKINSGGNGKNGGNGGNDNIGGNGNIVGATGRSPGSRCANVKPVECHSVNQGDQPVAPTDPAHRRSS